MEVPDEYGFQAGTPMFIVQDAFTTSVGRGRGPRIEGNLLLNRDIIEYVSMWPSF